MSLRTRRARHSRQVFGLAGAHRVVLLMAVASQSLRVCQTLVTSACDGGRSCIPLRDSPGLIRGYLYAGTYALVGLFSVSNIIANWLVVATFWPHFPRPYRGRSRTNRR